MSRYYNIIRHPYPTPCENSHGGIVCAYNGVNYIEIHKLKNGGLTVNRRIIYSQLGTGAVNKQGVSHF